MRLQSLAVFALPLSACAGYAQQPEAPAPLPEAKPATTQVCDAARVQHHLGHDATQAMGEAILAESGARMLRWGPPNSVWTMDYRVDRVNIRYDGEMKITAITCG